MFLIEVRKEEPSINGTCAGLTEFAEPGNQDPQGHQVRVGDMMPLPGHNRQRGDVCCMLIVTTFSRCAMA